jgi:hypothetical protein
VKAASFARSADAIQAGSRPTRWATSARWLVVAATIALVGCGILPRNAVPVELMPEASIPGLPDVRATAGRRNAAMTADLALSFAQELPAEFPLGPDGVVRYPHLALSGGGANGAFGAGFLNGWTTTGRRPVFKIVTGVSTGALMAPFAFIGPTYDVALREFYTTTDTRNILQVLSIIPQLLGGESFADSAPLRALLEQHVDAELLRQVAQAHAKGRRLYVGTADLDSQSFVVWNMGLIASSGHPDALALFRRVMLASASIPVAFPPVLFEVEAGSRRYDEMHVDGGVGANVFISGGVFSFSEVRQGVPRGIGRQDLFVIHNGQLQSVPRPTSRSLRSIGLRSLESASKAAFVGDLFRVYAVSQREEAGFNWITMPNGVELAGDELFDPVLMRGLFDLGYANALAGQVWATVPPGLPPHSER